MKYFLVGGVVVVLVLTAYWFGLQNNDLVITTEVDTEISTTTVVTTENNATTSVAEVTLSTRGPVSMIGTSTDGHPIMAYHFGTGPKEIIFIGGIHGGYSWSTNLLAYELIDQLNREPRAVPNNLTITIIPTLNPDGLMTTTGTTSRFNASDVREANRIAGRFNGNDVDLNRNFDCEWAKTSNWQNRTVSGGDAPFSENEARALRDYVTTHRPVAVVTWYSAEGAVYASQCGDMSVPLTTELVTAYANASGYTAKTDFDAYAITGDLMNWLAKENIAAVSVLLSSHTATEWEKNWSGVQAIISALTTD